MLGAGPGGVWAAEAGPSPDPHSVFNLQLENDLWGKGTDRHYTHGTRLSYLSPERAAGVEGAIKDFLDRYIPEFFKPDTNRISLLAGQSLFTPDNIAREELIRDDRPYAGWLYVGAGLVSEKTTGDRPFLDLFEINLGVVGPAALAEETQTFVHKLKNVQRPKGWRHQLANEPGIVFFYQRKWPFRPRGSPGGMEVDWTPSAGFALGNVYTYLSLGAMLRIGENLPNDYGPPLIQPGLSGSGFFKPQDDFGWYVFAGVEGRAVGHNIFLDGNTYESSHRVTKEVFVGDLQVGVVITLFQRVQLGFTNVFRTTEFKKQREGDEFGSINLAFRW